MEFDQSLVLIACDQEADTQTHILQWRENCKHIGQIGHVDTNWST